MRGLLGSRRLPPPLPLFPTAKRSTQPAASRLLARIRRLLPFSRLLRLLLLVAVLSLVPPVFFHFRLRRFHRMRERKCGWIASPPMVCAHGGDSTNAFPNSVCRGGHCGLPWNDFLLITGGSYTFLELTNVFTDTLVSCWVLAWFRWKHSGWLWIPAWTVWSLMSRGPLMACFSRCTTGRDLQRMSGNLTAKVGYWSTDEIKALGTLFQLSKSVSNEEVPKAEDVLAMISQSVRQVILDVKVGPPSFEKSLAEDVLSLIKKTNCKNCLVWAKSDALGTYIIKLSKDVLVGYIVMVDMSTGRSTELVRINGAKVAGIYHPLIHEKVVKVMRRHGRKVFAWTVDDANSMRKMLYENVDAIVTSNPSLLQQLMQDTRAECLEDGFSLP